MNTGAGLFLTVLLMVALLVGFGVLSVKIVDFVAENQSLKVTLERVQDQIDHQQEANQGVYEEIQGLNGEIMDLTRQLDQERAVNQTLQDKLSELNDRLGKLQGAYESERQAKEQAQEKLARVRSVEAFFENLKSGDAGAVVAQLAGLEDPAPLAIGLAVSAILAFGASLSLRLVSRGFRNRRRPASDRPQAPGSQVDAPAPEGEDGELVNVTMTRSQASDYARWRRSHEGQNGSSQPQNGNGKEKAHKLGSRVDEDRWGKRSQDDLPYAV